jgi:hypothetical protein
VPGHDTFGIRIRRKTIELIWRHMLVIYVDTKAQFLKKAGE